jgi:YVTN family beta-propeller protein
MKIRKNHIHLFILLFAVSSLLVHSPPQAFAEEEGVITTISVGDSPNEIAFDSENNRMYVTNYNDDTVSVINTADNLVIATVTIGNTPNGIAFDSTNDRMYYSLGNWLADITKRIRFIDTADHSVSSNIAIAEPIAYGIAFDSENDRMYVVNWNGWGRDYPRIVAPDNATVSVINTANNSEIATITVGDNSRRIAFDSTNDRMYVTNYADDTVSVISTANNSVIATVSVGDQPTGIAFDSTNDRMYVLNGGDDTVSVISTANNSVIATVSVGETPWRIAFDSTNDRMYVTNVTDDTVSVIDTATNLVIDTIPVGDNPQGIAFDPVNNRMYVINRGDDTVSVIGILPPTTSSGGSSDDLINPNPYLTDEILVSVGPNKPIVTQSDGMSNIQIQKGDNITITLNAADDAGPVLDTNTFSGQSEVESVSLYTNFGPRPSGMNLYYANHLNDQRDTSKTFYEWYKYKDDVIYDFENTVSWADAVVTTEDKFTISITDTDTETTSSTEGKLTITFSATWDEVMPKSEIIVKAVDSQMGYSTTTLPFTLQVGEYDQSYEDLFGTSTDYRFVPLIMDYKVRESVEQWVDPLSGMTDEKFVSSLGLDGDKLPEYVKHLAQWVVEDKIDLADLIIAVEYIINVK